MVRISPSVVLDGRRGSFPLAVLKCIFTLKKKGLVNPKIIRVFWCRQDQKETGGAEIYFLRLKE